MTRSRQVFALGVLVFLAYKFTFTGIPLLYRDLPVEVDDAYSYIVKAPLIDQCSNGDCPALHSLRNQIFPLTQDPSAFINRVRVHQRVFIHYHPLYSLAIISLHKAGLNWEASYNVSRLIGVVIIGAGVAVFLQTLFGFQAAGLALLLLAGVVFPGLGLNLVAPTNISLGIAMLTWGLIVRRTPGAGLWLPILIILCMGTHYIGRAWSVVTLLLLLSTWKRSPAAKDLLTLILSVSVFVVILFLPTFVSELNLGNPSRAWNFQLDWPSHLKETMTVAFSIVNRWALVAGGIGLAILLAISAMIFNPSNRRIPQVILFLSLSGLCFVSLLFLDLPGHPVAVFRRTWVPLGVFLTGAISFTMCKTVPLIFRQVFPLLRREGKITDAETLLTKRGWAFLATGVTAFIAGNMLLSFMVETAATSSGIKYSILRHNFFINRNQTNLIFDGDKTCGAIVYDSEISLYSYLTRGGLHCEAIYLPAILGTSEEKILHDSVTEITHVVFINPIKHHMGRIPLSSRDEVILKLNPKKAVGSLQVLLVGGSKETMLRVTIDKQTLSEIFIKPGQKSWVTLDNLPHGDNDIFINFRLADEAKGNYIKGVRLVRELDSKVQSTLWPWNRGVEVAYSALKQNGIRIDIKTDFDLRGIIPFKSLSGKTFEVVNDNGLTVLAKIRHLDLPPEN